jgi:hypothetical protein
LRPVNEGSVLGAVIGLSFQGNVRVITDKICLYI